jgi:hypothetical protein
MLSCSTALDVVLLTDFHSFPLSNIKYRRHRSFINPFRRHEYEDDFIDLGGGRVQLWTELVGPCPEVYRL